MSDALLEMFGRLHAEDYACFADLCGQLTFEQLWRETPSGVPVANTLCHVAEMERFWIDWGLCGEPFERNRQIEFDRRGDLTGEQLAARLADRRDRTAQRIAALPAEQWDRPREFHGDRHTGRTIVLWHLRHLGIHRGQVIVHRRWIESRA